VTKTDKNGVWALSFQAPEKTLPGSFEGVVIPVCGSVKVPINGELEMTYNAATFIDKITRRAGSITDLIKDIAMRALYGVRAPSIKPSTKYVAYVAFEETEVTCSKEAPVTEGPTQVIEETPAPKVFPKAPEPVAPPKAPPTPPETSPMPPLPKDTEKPKYPVDEYAQCVDRCGPILKKLEPLKKRLKELEERASKKTAKLKDEYERLKNAYERSLASSKQQKYIAPDGKEHWGSVRIEKLYKENGYKPVSGTATISPEAQRFLDFLKKKIEEIELKLAQALKEDEKDKEKERAQIESEMAKIRREYEDCVKACDRFKKAPSPPPSRDEQASFRIEEEIQYKKLEADVVTCETGVLYKKTDAGMDVAITIIPTGKGADFRRWLVDNVRIDLGGDRIKPCEEKSIYVEKESLFREPAVVAFAAIGAQYRHCADTAQSEEVCPVTGQKKAVYGGTKDTISDEIDRAGMAVGLGLLASQAKGHITGKRCVFKLDKDQTKKLLDKKGEMDVVVGNKERHEERTFKIPLYQ
jgi:hypothetical protein